MSGWLGGALLVAIVSDILACLTGAAWAWSLGAISTGLAIVLLALMGPK